MGKKYFVQESLNEFAKRGRPKKVKPAAEGDDWYSADDEFDAPEVGPEQIEDVEIEDEVMDAALAKRITKRLENELAAPEFNRGVLKFTNRQTGEVINGVPMAKMKDKFYFKDAKTGAMKGVRVEDILTESEDPKKFVSESFRDYE